MAGQTILREYLMSLGFKVDTTGQRKWDTAVTGVNKGAIAAGLSVGGLAATIAVLAEKYANAMEKMYYAGRRSGTPVAQLKAMDYAGQQVGMAAGRTTQLVNTMASALRLNPGLISKLTQLGIQTKGRTAAQEWLDLIDKTASMKYYKGANTVAMFGIDDESYQIARQNRVEMREAMEEQLALYKEMGVDQDANAKAMADWKKEVRSMTAMFEILEGVVAGKLLGTMEKIVSQTKTLTTGLIKDLSTATGFMDFMVKRANTAARTGSQKGMPWDAGGPSMTLDTDQWSTFRHWLVGLGHEPGYADKRLGGPATPGTPMFGGSTTATAKSSGAAPTAATGDRRAFLGRLETQWGLPNGLLYAVEGIESAHGKQMVSKAGAKGWFGFKPKTAEAYGIAGKENDPIASAQASAHMWHDMFLQYGGDLNKAVAGYNYGAGNFAKVGNDISRAPKETQAYAATLQHAINQTNNITINGGGPTVASAVRQGLGQANGDLVRNMKTVVQ